MTQSCNTCIHRPYGESRFHIDCMIYEPFWSRKKPHPKSFGAKCQRYEAPAPSGLESSSEHPAKHEQNQ